MTEEQAIWTLKEITLPDVEENGEGFTACKEACGVVLNRLTQPDSRERFQFFNNQVYWNLHRLETDELSWDDRHADGPWVTREALLVDIPGEDAQVFRDCIDEVYDRHEVPQEARSAYDAAFEIMVSGFLGLNGAVAVLDEETGEEVPPRPLLEKYSH